MIIAGNSLGCEPNWLDKKNWLKMLILVILKFVGCYLRQLTISMHIREQKFVFAQFITLGILVCYTLELHRM